MEEGEKPEAGRRKSFRGWRAVGASHARGISPNCLAWASLEMYWYFVLGLLFIPFHERYDSIPE